MILIASIAAMKPLAVPALALAVIVRPRLLRRAGVDVRVGRQPEGETMSECRTEYGRVEHARDCVGKTIVKAIGDVDSIGFAFGDGTYYFAVADGGEDARLCRSEDIGPADAIRLGIIDRAEFDRACEARKRAKEAEERARYERLKAKFEAPSDHLSTAIVDPEERAVLDDHDAGAREGR